MPRKTWAVHGRARGFHDFVGFIDCLSIEIQAFGAGLSLGRRILDFVVIRQMHTLRKNQWCFSFIYPVAQNGSIDRQHQGLVSGSFSPLDQGQAVGRILRQIELKPKVRTLGPLNSTCFRNIFETRCICLSAYLQRTKLPMALGNLLLAISGSRTTSSSTL